MVTTTFLYSQDIALSDTVFQDVYDLNENASRNISKIKIVNLNFFNSILISQCALPQLVIELFTKNGLFAFQMSHKYLRKEPRKV